MSTEIAPTPNGKRILVVDDDAGTRLLITHHLRKQGYETTAAACVNEAQKIFASDEKVHYDAIVTDYLMPDGTGLDLLEWVKEQDKALAAIFVTAVGERDLVKQSLRTGACDFLDKPVQVRLLLESVANAVIQTGRQRALEDAESSVKEVGKLQQFMLGANPGSLPGILDICWHPKHAAGGDLVNVFSLGSDRLVVVVADVSGHDLKAGFISAFFQGVVRGMIANRAPINTVFSYFNEFLSREWNGNQADPASQFDVSASVSACAFDIDFKTKQLTVWNSGFPIPLFTEGSGRSHRCGTSASYPLGWFDDDPTTRFDQAITNGGSVYAWTDGLEERASQLGVNALSLARILLNAKQEGLTPPFLKDCGDDILVVRINLAPTGNGGGGFKPLIYDEYFADHGPRIDQLQTQWERSLQTMSFDISEEKLFDLLLCSREAVINGIKYGCAATPDAPCTYEIAYHPEARILRAIINDPGPGHTFDWEQYAKLAEEQMLDAHRGLLLMNRLPARTTFERNGAIVTMDFDLKQP